MKTILFIILPFPSHYNACLGLMNYQKKAGNRIIVSTTQLLSNYTKALGFESVNLFFLTDLVIKNLRSFIAVFIESRLSRAFLLRQYREYITCINLLNSTINDIKPDHIFIDSTLDYYCRFLPNHSDKVILINTRLSNKKRKGIPPYSVSWEANSTLSSFVRVEFEWLKYNSSLFMENIVSYLALGKANEKYIVRRLIKKIYLKNGNSECKSTNNDINESNYLEWILCPRVFEYPWFKVRKNEKYVWIDAREKHGSLSDDLSKWLEDTSDFKFLAYCSFGTLSDNPLYRENVVIFLKKLLNVSKEIPNLRLVIATKLLTGADLNEKLTNIYITSYVSQINLLPMCNFAIIHGGMNSVKECISAGVPMLVYPLNLKVDQPGNAARIKFHKIGISDSLSKVSDISLRENIFKLLYSNEFIYYVQKMQKAFLEEDRLYQVNF